ncbi:hypothetical protein MMC25_006347 [Agyrium rufum]|nr:hypothetical protein [Agyrium rufum]
MAIKNVAIAGATGNSGSAILKALVDSNKFNVTVLIRSDSTTTPSFPESVSTRTVDYSKTETLVESLKGQDAVVSALNHAFLGHQHALLDASVTAGVQRFIPSEYGSDTLNAKAAKLPLFTNKLVEQKYVEDLAVQGKITWTLVITGPFLDFGIGYGFLGPNIKKRQITYLDGGNGKFSTTTLPTVGKAVVGVLSKPEETKNRAVYVQEAALTLKDLFGMAKKALGEDDWTEVDGGTTEEMEKASYEKLSKGQKDMGVMIGFLMSAIFREGYGGYFEHVDNELLGITEMKESEIVELIRGIARKQQAA